MLLSEKLAISNNILPETRAYSQNVIVASAMVDLAKIVNRRKAA